MELIQTKSFQIAANTKGDPDAGKLALLLPGRLDTKDYANFVSHLDYLSERGYYTVAIDPPYTWDSPGDLENYTTTNYVKAVNELIDHFGSRPTLLLGHSRGGATAMLASPNPVVIGLVLVNAAYGPPTPPEPDKIIDGTLLESRDMPPGDVRTKEQRKYQLPLVYFEDGAKHNPREILKAFKGPKLLVHATRDEFTGLELIRPIFDEVSEPKMFLEIDCTHDYRLYPEIIQQVEETLGRFNDSYLSDY
ncbi:alpha/beta hydrolase [Candidatus Saccharibacteria bacterium]|nr:alpha/beta hydrolase [Candidatus Saccharibacteria bacterium]